MVNNFIFIEDGSLNEGNLNKLRKGGITDEKMIVYRQGAIKPELVSVEQETPQMSNELVLEALEEYLDNTAEKRAEEYYDNWDCKFKMNYTLTIDGKLDEFMSKFRKFVEEKYGK